MSSQNSKREEMVEIQTKCMSGACTMQDYPNRAYITKNGKKMPVST